IPQFRAELTAPSIQGSIAVSDGIAFTNPGRDERPSGNGLDIERPQHRHERPEEQLPGLYPLLQHGGNFVPAKPAIHGRGDSTRENRPEALTAINMLETVAVEARPGSLGFQTERSEKAAHPREFCDRAQ